MANDTEPEMIATVQPFDFNALSILYTTGAKLGSAQHANILREGVLKNILDNKGILPPWKIKQPTVDDSQLLSSLLSSKPLINTSDPMFKREDLTDDYKNLFALWKGLNNLQTLTEFSKTDKRAEGMRNILDKQFQNKSQEIFDYLGKATFLDVTMLQGMKIQSLESSVKRPDTTGTSYSYYGFPLATSQTEYTGATATTARADPITGLTGSETFTINVTEGGTTTAVAIDLANVTGGLSIDNIVTYINSQLTAAGTVATYFDVVRENEFSYKIRANLSQGEDISFTSGATGKEAAVYVAGSFGSGELSGGFLSKFDSLATASPTNAFRQDINTDKADSANGVAVDSTGNVYVVGTSAGNIDDQVNSASSDVYLNKYDAGGSVIWSRLLGASDSASGFSVAVDSQDNVVIAGQTTAPLTGTAYGGNSDAFITQFDGTGQELWTRQAAPYANDGGLALSIDASDNIFLSGFADAAVASDQTYGGGRDAFVTKVDSTGILQYNKQFGGTGNETASAVTVDNAGNIFVAYSNGTNAFVRKYADNATATTPTFEADLGAFGSDGGVTGLAVDGSGGIYASGYTSGSSLNGTAVGSYSGGTDGFVTRVDTTSGAVDWVSYVGTTGDDRAASIAVNGTDIYITGGTAGQLAGATRVGDDSDGFLTKLDNTGAVQWNSQFGGAFATRGASLAFDNTGTNVLTRLGLREGAIPGDSSGTLTAQTSARAGQQFTLSVDGAPAKTITIENGDTFQWLAFKIGKALGDGGTAYFQENGDTQYLVIKATNGARVDIAGGPTGFDALTSLGLRESTLYGAAGSEAQLTKAKSIFELGFINNLDLLSKENAGAANDILENAKKTVRDAFNFLLRGPDYDPLNDLPPQISAAAAEKIAALKSTLAFIRGLSGAPQGGSSFGLSI